MKISIPKSQFKPKAFEYLRFVQERQEEIIITDHGTPVARIVPIARDEEPALMELREMVVKYEAPFAPVAEDDWEAGR